MGGGHVFCHHTPVREIKQGGLWRNNLCMYVRSSRAADPGVSAGSEGAHLGLDSSVRVTSEEQQPVTFIQL